MTSANLILNAKKALRQTVSATLRALPDSEVQHQSELILKHVFALPIFQRSKTVSCYLSMKGEVDTSEIAREILRTGKSLYVPKIASRKDRRMDLLRVYDFGDLDSLPSGTWGIKEPDPEYDGRRRSSIFDDDAEPLDLILVPGVAFDTSLSRLGHGKGYYDIFIDTYSKKKAQESSPCPQLLALSLRQQMLPLGQIPMAEHDRPMDAIVTSDGVVTGKTESPVAKLL